MSLERCQRGGYRMPTTCSVCGEPCRYFFYGVASCGSCKHFFRRVVCLRKNYFCRFGGGICDISKDHKCKSCRFDKCILVGMNAQNMRNQRPTEMSEILAFFEQRRKSVTAIGVDEKKLTRATIEHGEHALRLLDHLMSIESVYKRIWDWSSALPEAYTNRHGDIHQMLEAPSNLFGHLAEYAKDKTAAYVTKSEIIAQIDGRGAFWCTPFKDIVVKDLFLCIETAKAFPHFGQLNAEDKFALLTHVTMPVVMFSSAFYSHAIGAQTVTRANGFAVISLQEYDAKFGNDQKLHAFYEVFLCELVQRISQIGMEYEEFMMLLFILFVNADAEGLSQSGRDLLYQESVKATKCLHQMLQTKLGHFAGSQRFAALMSQLILVFKAKQALIQSILYLEVLYGKQDPRECVPSALAFCFDPE